METISRFVSWIALSLLIAAAGCSTIQRSDVATLQGNWKGYEIGAENLGACHMNVSGNNLEFRSARESEWYKGTFVLREDANPRQLIGTISDCPSQRYIGKPVHAIYRLEAGKLTISANEPGRTQPPASFENPESRTFSLTKE